MIINNNMTAKNAYRNLNNNNAKMSDSIEKLSSGVRVNKAGDDAAGLAISEKMRAQVKGLDAAMKNAQNGISLIQTAEGALFETHSILQRMRELSIQAANDTNTTNDRMQMQLEMDELRQELDRIAEATEFNTRTLFNGDYSKMSDALNFHVGANKDQNMKANLERMDADYLGVADSDENKSISIKTASDANKAIEKFDAAIEIVSKERAKYGAIQNRMEYSINNLGIASENMQAAESRIRDTDVAKEMMELSKTKIITDSSVSMLAQANTIPQEVLKLIEN